MCCGLSRRAPTGSRADRPRSRPPFGNNDLSAQLVSLLLADGSYRSMSSHSPAVARRHDQTKRRLARGLRLWHEPREGSLVATAAGYDPQPSSPAMPRPRALRWRLATSSASTGRRGSISALQCGAERGTKNSISRGVLAELDLADEGLGLGALDVGSRRHRSLPVR